MDRRITVRVQIDYDITIPKEMKMDELSDLLIQNLSYDEVLPESGITLNDRWDRFIRTKKFRGES